MARLAAVIDPNADDRSAAGDDAGSGPWRALLAALGLAAGVYLLLRWRRSDAESPLDALPESLADEAGDVLENAQPIEIGEPGEGGDEDDSGSDADESPSLDSATTDRSAEEIAERTESDVQEEPAEPGEMTIDEEVADEVVDEDEDDES